jgi:hypothetical protein
MPTLPPETYETTSRRGKHGWLPALLGDAVSVHDFIGIYVESLRTSHKEAAESKRTHAWKDNGTFGYDRYKAIIDEITNRAKGHGVARLNSTQSFVLPFGSAEVYAFRFSKKPNANVYSSRLPEDCDYIRRALRRGPAFQIPIFGSDSGRTIPETILVPWSGDSSRGLSSVYFGQATLTDDDYLDWYNLDEVQLQASVLEISTSTRESMAVGDTPHASSPPPDINFEVPEN